MGRLRFAAALAAGLMCTGAAGYALTTSWSTNNTAPGNATNNLNSAANWSAGLPDNGTDAFMVWSRPTAGGATTKILTNASTDLFLADSLSVTNTGKDNVFVYFNGSTHLTNGTGQLNYAGATSAGDITLAFSNTFEFVTLSFRDSNGSGIARLVLAGAATGQNFTFTGGTGKNELRVTGPLTVAGTFAATNLNVNQAGTISGNATIGRLLINNTLNNRITFQGAATTLTGSSPSVAGGFTLAGNATLSLSGAGGLIISNVAPLINGTIHVNDRTLQGKTNWTNAGTVTIGGGIITGSTLTNAGRITGQGTISAPLQNTGTITVTADGLTFESLVVNSGRIEVAGGVAYFQGNLSLTTAGILTAGAGMELRFRRDFLNASTAGAAFDLSAASVHFDGGGLVTQQFLLAGLDLGADESGFTNNFAIGALTIGGSGAGLVQLTGAAGRALYVDSLTVSNGSTLWLNGFTVYTKTVADLQGEVVAGGGAIVLVPEPGTTALVVTGIVLLVLLGYRRHPATGRRGWRCDIASARGSR